MHTPFDIPGSDSSKRLKNAVEKLNELIEGLYRKELNAELQEKIEETIIEVKRMKGTEREKARFIERRHQNLVNFAQKSMGYVTPKFYQNLWLALGMGVFGVPLGVAYSASLDNYAFIGIGIPIGMAIGIGIGTAKDKKAKEEGLVIE
jgi:hypothetical protein